MTIPFKASLAHRSVCCTNLHKMARSRLVKISIENGVISNVKTPRITNILTYIIEVMSYDRPTVSRTLVFAALKFGRRRNCQTLAPTTGIKTTPDEFIFLPSPTWNVIQTSNKQMLNTL